MQIRKFLGWSSALCLGAMTLEAQEANQIEQLQRQLIEMQEQFERQQQEQRRQIETLQRQLEQITKTQADATAGQEELRGMVESRFTRMHETAYDEGVPVERRWSPTDPIRIGTDRNFLDVSFNGLFAAGTSTASDIAGGTQLGGHDPQQRGFTVQNLETTFVGMVDPYFRGQASIVFQIDRDGESFIEAEEAYLDSLAFPANLQLRAGQFFTEFGRHNQFHPHAWSFVDTPLVNGRFLGPDGLRNPGARLSWLAPTPFYSELFLAVKNSQGVTAHSFRGGDDHHGGGGELPLGFRHPDNDRGVRGLDDLLFVPRYALSFDVTDTQVVVAGASAAFGPNASGGDDAGSTRTQLYGLDLLWKWKPVTHSGGFPFVSWQTEAMLRRYQAGEFDWADEPDDEPRVVYAGTMTPAMLPAETLVDYGFYSQLLYGFRKGWVAGLRFDYVTGRRGDYERLDLDFDGEALGRDLERSRRWRLSPNLTWYPSEFSKFRLQYNYDDRAGIGIDHSIWLQFEFLLGAHGAHKF